MFHRWSHALPFSPTSILAFCGLMVCFGVPTRAAETDPAIDFQRDVRPILSDHCFACHGPDSSRRQSDLRLDRPRLIRDSGVSPPTTLQTNRATARDHRPASGRIALDLRAGLIDRITTDDPDQIMPPPGHQKPLSAQDIEVLRRWIADGGQWSEHWSFSPIEASSKRTPSDAASQPNDLASTIDHWIDQAIIERGLRPNSRADDSALLRRVYLGLIGLPPSPEQVAAFLKNPSPDRYRNVVDELLDSPEFGRHLGRYWLDLVRYADTHGLHYDNYRQMWPYRDWVIDAINDNMPFDQFITKQIAGDLIPDSTEADKIASGLNRLNPTTNEAGTIYDEVLAKNAIDRTGAFGTIFLGLTTQCAACHDHKFDPLTQSDFYSLLAFFNSLDGRAMDGNQSDHPPSIRIATEQQKKILAELNEQIAAIESQMRGPIASVDRDQSAWMRSFENPRHGDQILTSTTDRDDAAGIESIDAGGWITPVGGKADAESGSETEPGSETKTVTIQSTLRGDVAWQSFRVEIEFRHDQPAEARRRFLGRFCKAGKPTFFLADNDQWLPIAVEASIADLHGGESSRGFSTAWFSTPGFSTPGLSTQGMFSESRSVDVRVRLALPISQIGRFRVIASDHAPRLPDSLSLTLGTFAAIGPFELADADSGYRETFVPVGNAPPDFDAATDFHGEPMRWRSMQSLVPVQIHSLDRVETPDRSDQRPSVTTLYRRIDSPLATTADLLIGADGGLVVDLNGVEIYRRLAADFDPLSQTIPLALNEGVNHLYLRVIDHAHGGGADTNRFTFATGGIAVAKPADLAGSAQRDYFRRVVCVHPDWTALSTTRNAMVKQRSSLLESLPTTLVWKETSTPRPQRILVGGQYDHPGPSVSRRTPRFLPPMPDDAPNNRLGLARWLTEPSHPLTARVAVNRYWQMLFGTGLVKTSEDLGSQGETPTHPELLDDLASEFIANRWDVKALIRSMVLSEAFCRDSKLSDPIAAADPSNRFYARGPRFRLDAEVLRDQALSIGGLLQPFDGGPSVKPPQPNGLWSAVGYPGSNTEIFVPDRHADQYRRSVYTFWKRTSPPPQMTIFGAPGRDVCTSRRERTNTPMQALVLLNEIQYLDAARGFADRAMAEKLNQTPIQQATWMFRSATARSPRANETIVLETLLDDLIGHYREHPNLATELTGTAAADRAALVVLASTMLNLDQVISN